MGEKSIIEIKNSMDCITAHNISHKRQFKINFMGQLFDKSFMYGIQVFLLYIYINFLPRNLEMVAQGNLLNLEKTFKKVEILI